MLEFPVLLDKSYFMSKSTVKKHQGVLFDLTSSPDQK